MRVKSAVWRDSDHALSFAIYVSLLSWNMACAFGSCDPLPVSIQNRGARTAIRPGCAWADCLVSPETPPLESNYATGIILRSIERQDIFQCPNVKTWPKLSCCIASSTCMVSISRSGIGYKNMNWDRSQWTELSLKCRSETHVQAPENPASVIFGRRHRQLTRHQSSKWKRCGFLLLI